MAAPSKRPVRAHGSTREEILAAAEALFAERGYAATSIRHIVQASGVKAPSLYHHFGSKEQLLGELVRLRYTEYCERLDETLADEATPEGVCEAYVRFVLANMKEEPVTAKFLFSLMFGPQQDIPSGALDDVLMSSERLVQKRLREVAPPGVKKNRLTFARTMLLGMVTPAVLAFLTTGTNVFPRDLPRCIALRAAEILDDPHPVCKWPEISPPSRRS